jgi:hypothetical protein
MHARRERDFNLQSDRKACRSGFVGFKVPALTAEPSGEAEMKTAIAG